MHCNSHAQGTWESSVFCPELSYDDIRDGKKDAKKETNMLVTARSTSVPLQTFPLKLTLSLLKDFDYFSFLHILLFFV